MKSILRTLSLYVGLAVLLGVANTGNAKAQSDEEWACRWQTAWDVYEFYEWASAPLPWDARKRVSRVISTDINAPIDHVFEVYSDINNHIGRHALLQRVITHDEFSEDGIHQVNFTALENLQLIPGVPVTIATHAVQRIDEANYSYTSDTWTLPNVVTHQTITFTDLGGGRTRITENLTFEANFTLINYTVDNGVAAHQATLAAMKRDLEAGTI